MDVINRCVSVSVRAHALARLDHVVLVEIIVAAPIGSAATPADGFAERLRAQVAWGGARRIGVRLQQRRLLAISVGAVWERCFGKLSSVVGGAAVTGTETGRERRKTDSRIW